MPDVEAWTGTSGPWRTGPPPMYMMDATALVYGLTAVTRNHKHFEPTGAADLNPFST